MSLLLEEYITFWIATLKTFNWFIQGITNNLGCAGMVQFCDCKDAMSSCRQAHLRLHRILYAMLCCFSEYFVLAVMIEWQAKCV